MTRCSSSSTAPSDFEDTLGDYGDAVWQQLVDGAPRCRRRLLHVAGEAGGGVAEVDEGCRARWRDLGGLAEEDRVACATDITEDVLRADILPSGWVDNKVCAIDDTWSGLRFVLRKELRPKTA